jgi:hypothetical protein
MCRSGRFNTLGAMSRQTAAGVVGEASLKAKGKFPTTTAEGVARKAKTAAALPPPFVSSDGWAPTAGAATAAWSARFTAWPQTAEADETILLLLRVSLLSCVCVCVCVYSVESIFCSAFLFFEYSFFFAFFAWQREAKDSHVILDIVTRDTSRISTKVQPPPPLSNNARKPRKPLTHTASPPPPPQSSFNQSSIVVVPYKISFMATARGSRDFKYVKKFDLTASTFN